MSGSDASAPQAQPTSLATLLSSLAASLSGHLDLDDLLDDVVQSAMEVTGARYGALGVLSADRNSLVRFIHHGLPPATAAQIGAPPTGGGLLGALIRHPVARVVDHLPADPEFQGFPADHPPMTTFMGTPIRVDGRVFGNVYLTDKDGGFTEEDLRVITILAALAGMAIHTAELAQSLRALAVDEERERISRDLHDGVIQSIFSVGMGLEGAKSLIGRDDARLGERMDAAVDQLDGTIREIRSTIFTLRPGSGELGLQGGLVELAREYEVNEIVRPALNVSQSLDAAVPEDVVPDVLHIVREALSNVAKHAQTTTVLLEADTEGEALVVRVRDGGAGFNPDALSPGNGLENMTERAVLLGAALDLDSAPGQGTTVTLTVPLTSHSTAGPPPGAPA